MPKQTITKRCIYVKKNLLLIATVAFLVISVTGTYAVFNRIFPKADPINVPNTDNIISVSVFQDDDTVTAVDETNVENLLKSIKNARPTRKMSVNDYPAVKTYYIIDINTPTKEYRYFLYEENSRFFVELPYEGIYETDQQLFDFVSDYFKA